MNVSVLAAALLLCAAARAQKPELEFYEEFRNTFIPKVRGETLTITNEEILQRYAARLRSEATPEAEISRRVALIRDSRELLEADYWNRFYTSGDSKFNKAPNGFLVQAVAGLRKGAALDYAMGEGRNALYLAQLGWEVWGFDHADAAVALAQKRAKELGLTLHTSAVRDSEYEFGKNRFDLILFSWSMPLVPVERVVAALKPGGVVVMECAQEFVGRNGMLKLFDALRIVRYEVVTETADFSDRRQSNIVRLIARKE